MKFKVGDRVKSNQPGLEYTGTVVEINSDILRIDRGDRYGGWACRVVGDKVATADGVWDNKSYLELVSKAGRPRKEKPYQYVVIYDINRKDPHKLFYTKKEMEKWLLETLEDEDNTYSNFQAFKLDHEMSIKFDTKVIVRKKYTKKGE